MGLIVLKFGGEITENKTELMHLISSVKALQTKGEKIILVHGGGPAATALSQKLGIESKFVGGRRITDEATLEVMKMTLPGLANTNVLSMCKKNNIRGVAVNGLSVIEATKRPPKVVSGSKDEVVDFGLVGDITAINDQLLLDLLEKNYLPILSPLASDSSGQVLNINADTVAVKIAQKMHADQFVFITSVGGVFASLTDKNSRFKKLTIQEAKELIAQGIIQGGMIPKLEEAFLLLREQLQSFHIVGLHTADDVLNEITHAGSIGTVIVR
jgi:acetylglutamate kinase